MGFAYDSEGSQPVGLVGGRGLENDRTGGWYRAVFP